MLMKLGLRFWRPKRDGTDSLIEYKHWERGSGHVAVTLPLLDCACWISELPD